MSLIARQRDLAEMVGEGLIGPENKLLRDSLQWSDSRYETVTLEDRNLPAFVERRVLKPKNAEAAKSLDEASNKLKKSAAHPAWKTMLRAGRQGRANLLPARVLDRGLGGKVVSRNTSLTFSRVVA
jgi:hypothetical protein